MATYTSKAFRYLGEPRAVRRELIAVECGPRDLVVRVSMCARCGTDKTIYYHGHPNVDPHAPVAWGTSWWRGSSRWAARSVRCRSANLWFQIDGG